MKEFQVTDDKKLEACLTLYKQQMEHYHKTQDIEWKGTFGAWTLVGAAVAATFQPTWHVPSGVWGFPILVVPLLHCVWLLTIHNSEEEDKVFWTKYRNEACALAGLQKEPDYPKRTWWNELTWLVTEAGITLGFAGLFWWRVS
jgi:hypothetical protein